MIEKNEKTKILKEFRQKVEQLSFEMDKKAAVIEIKENNEKLRNLKDIYEIMLSPKLNNCSVREELFNKLRRINKKLKKKNIALFVADGWRSTEKQQEYWEQEIEKSKKEHPDITDAEKISKIASRFVANPKKIAGHPTGGSVDVSLYNLETCELVDMGSNEDDTCEISYSDYPFLNSEIKSNREMLKTVFEEENFINIPTEWWHFSYGNAEWAAYKDAAFAFYGTIRDLRKFVFSIREN